MSDDELYGRCRDAVAHVTSLREQSTVHKQLGTPERCLPVNDFFVTHEDLTVTYCDLVELFYYRNCAIRVGYINQEIVKVRGMPLEHWQSPDTE